MKKAHAHRCDCSKDVSHMIKHAEAQTRAKGERFTPLRREVIEALVKAGRPIGAYDLLKAMNAGRRKKISAMSLYRVLDYLQALGLAVRLESRNAYMPCHHEGHEHGHVMLVCDACGMIKEIDDRAVSGLLIKVASKHDLTLRHNVVELHGLCGECR